MGKSNSSGKPYKKGAERILFSRMNHTKVNENKMNQLLLEDRSGYVILTRGNGLFQFTVLVNELQQQSYQVQIERNNTSMIVLGEGNTHMKFGFIENEINLVPSHARLLFWTVHPERMFVEQGRYRLTIRDHVQKVVRQVPFFP